MPHKPRQARTHEPNTDRRRRAKPAPASNGLGTLA